MTQKNNYDFEFEYGEPDFTIDEENKCPCLILMEYNETGDYHDVSLMRKYVRECELKHKNSYHIECSDECPFWKCFH